ncbi:unnamed protein product [Eruca vesicaria subsp. sativa]|uniref:Phorbol-ester/DAG-type domain-containing protein n=1 Tax=Eruca vesicaria subsp. sativa TaxID=29727 RepID=A0ABC8KN55_ERUVS|nr:unnamed protein product [Eruca vesicaria subsp. sativa]
MAELNHVSHECALTVPKIVENGICNICNKDELVEYACDRCNFDLCKTCSYLPQKVSHDFHMEHPLEFCLPQNDQKQPRYIICSGCGSMSSGCFYECKECEIYLDLGCALMGNITTGWDAKELLSDYHAHLVKRCRPGPDARGSCLLCELSLSPSAICYGCVHCYLFFHEHCLYEIPTKILHPVHQSHPLKRFNYIQNCGANGRNCDACGGEIYSVPFGCSKCNFKLHLRCADSLLRGLMHHSHEHRLFYTNTSGSCRFGKTGYCHICKAYCGRPFYYCMECDSRFHMECLEIPNSVVDKSYHIHPLVCKVFLRDEDDDSLEYCGVCEMVVHTGHHAYCCGTCDFLSHIECTLRKGAEISPMYLKDLYSCDQDITDQDDSKTINLENELLVNSVGGHTHVLRSIALSELDERAKCNICSGIIYGKACKCETCSFQTHNFCAELGLPIRHRFHSNHPLTLLPDSPVAGISMNCDICRKEISGFNLFCRICSFIIHVQCVLEDQQFLGTLHRGQKLMVRNARGDDCIKTNTHGTYGATVSSSYLITCTICEERLCGKVVSCIDCREVYHPWCLKALRRRIPFHPLHPDHDLRFLVVSGSKCIVCKLNITKYGYTCRKCEVSLHFKCVKAVDIPEKIKYHIHYLYNFWEEHSTRVCSVCARRCGASFYGCVECNFSAHVECVGFPRYVKNQRHQHTVELNKSKDINCV